MGNAICYIVGAGEDYGLDFLPEAQDLVIAADGGYQRLMDAGIHPDLVIGDFDSLGRVPVGDAVITLPTEKDVTDTWAAIRIGAEKGYRCFFLYGCTGGRFEHTLANIQTVADVTMDGMECCLFDREQIITGLSGGEMQFDAGCSGFLSVFAHTDVCTGVTLRGLKYELSQAELTNRFPLGVSNEFVGKTASVSVRTGTLILVFDRKIEMKKISKTPHSVDIS